LNILNAIRQTPLNYLPEVSLTALELFESGYRHRCRQQGHSVEDDLGGNWRQFDAWIRERFGVGPSHFHVISIVRSFSANDYEAFHNYFSLRDEFLKLYPAQSEAPNPALSVKCSNLIELLQSIRERPAMYVGIISFRRCCLYLMGDERAYKDLGLTLGEDRHIFSDFKLWVQEKKNKAYLPRPWYAIISYYGTGGDCGHTNTGAFALFYDWLDEFASEIGKPELFQVAESWWQRQNRQSQT